MRVFLPNPPRDGEGDHAKHGGGGPPPHLCQRGGPPPPPPGERGAPSTTPLRVAVPLPVPGRI
jgi:hypothetical protein